MSDLFPPVISIHQVYCTYFVASSDFSGNILCSTRKFDAKTFDVDKAISKVFLTEFRKLSLHCYL